MYDTQELNRARALLARCKGNQACEYYLARKFDIDLDYTVNDHGV